MKGPKPTEVLLACLNCDWQVDAACRSARATWGNTTALFKLLAEEYDEHVREVHPGLINREADGSYVGYAMMEMLPRWWVHR